MIYLMLFGSVYLQSGESAVGFVLCDFQVSHFS